MEAKDKEIKEKYVPNRAAKRKWEMKERGEYVRSTFVPFDNGKGRSLSTHKRKIIAFLHEENLKNTIYMIEKLWGKLGLYSHDFTLRQLESIKGYPDRRKLGIEDPDTPLSDKWLSRAMDTAKGCVLSEVKQIIILLKGERKWRKKLQEHINAGRNGQAKFAEREYKKYQKLLAAKRNDRTPPTPKNIRISTTNDQCPQFNDKTKSFDVVIRIGGILTKYNDKYAHLFEDLGIPYWSNSIYIPLRGHKHFHALNDSCVKRDGGVSISPNGVHFSFTMPSYKDCILKGVVVGIDQGIRNAITAVMGGLLERGYLTETEYESVKDSMSFASLRNNHNHDIHTIIEILCRRKKGSKGYRRALTHMRQYIRWACNQFVIAMPVEAVETLFLEDLRRMGQGTNAGPYLSKFAHGEIRKKIKEIGEEYAISVKDAQNRYKSQRCNACGFTIAKNRPKKGKKFTCVDCGHEDDADNNAAANNHSEACNTHPIFYSTPAANDGFYWLEGGYFKKVKGKMVCIKKLPAHRRKPNPAKKKC